jgi:crotonobetainyl-CoA:carnitine CoA-transferase CaiB-like acyl-CoA transferase
MLALKGIKIIDFTTWVFAPGGTAMLADLGADVIKVEDPGTGDPQRFILMFGGLEVPDINFPWELENRNKKGIAIDLKVEQGKQIMYKLVEEADVFVSNVRAQALEKLGMDYETLSKINPRLIYAHGNGYGEEGPESNRPGFDWAAYWARGGIMGSLGEPDAPPIMSLPAYGDHTSSISLVAGITTALLVREREGYGQRVDVSLLATAMWCNSFGVVGAGVMTEEVEKRSRKDLANPLINYYKCRDGKWLQLVCLQSDRYWSDFCGILEIEHLEHDEKYENMMARAANPASLIAILDKQFLNRDREEWGRLFDEKEVIWAPIQSFKETLNDPQAAANGFVSELEHPEHGPFRLVNVPFKLSKTPSSIREIGPELGQHTEEVLMELGYSWEDIEAFKDTKAII